MDNFNSINKCSEYGLLFTLRPVASSFCATCRNSTFLRFRVVHCGVDNPLQFCFISISVLCGPLSSSPFYADFLVNKPFPYRLSVAIFSFLIFSVFCINSHFDGMIFLPCPAVWLFFWRFCRIQIRTTRSMEPDEYR